MDEPFDWLLGPQPPSRSQQPTAAPAPPNIADPYADVLRFLDEPRRRGVITLLAVGFYDGWRPTHHEVAQIVRSHCTGKARRSLDRYPVNGELNANYIVPSVFDPAVAKAVAAAVRKATT